MDLLTEVTELAKHLRDAGADAFGPLAAMVSLGGQLMAAFIAFLVVLAGRSFWAPPSPTLKHFPVRVCGLLTGVGVIALYVWSRNGGTAYDFMTFAVGAIALGVLSSILYFVLRLLLCFRCEFDREIYVRGFRLAGLSRRVLALRNLPPDELAKANAQLPLQRQLPVDPLGIQVPETEAVYFCQSGKNPEYVWTRWSLNLARALLFVVYLLVMAPLTLALAASALAVSQPQLQQKQEGGKRIIEVPADILFDFNTAQIRPGALPSLEQAAKILRDAHVQSVVIEGHADARGTDSVNVPLSLKRAEAVQGWLQARDDLKGVHFGVKGYGASRPIAPNVNPDGSDNPDGRAKNRRVTLIFDNPS